jgi:ATP-dependent RNA helicase RhlE
VLVFTRTKRRARNLAADLENKGYNVAALQGNMAQNARQAAMNGFRDGKYDILVATDIAARGIDVTEISHVINFDMPDTTDAYTHRIGRTGRAEQTGEAFTFATPADEPVVRDIEKVLGASIERRRLAGFDYGSFAVETRPQTHQSRQPRSRPAFAGGHRGKANEIWTRSERSRVAAPSTATHASATQAASSSTTTDPRRRRRRTGAWANGR